MLVEVCKTPSIHKCACNSGRKTCRHSQKSPIDAVVCSDLYSEEISREKESGSTPTFSRYFDDGFIYICPNITENLTLHKDQALFARALACALPHDGDVYAQNIACGEEKESIWFTFIGQLFSTNFDPIIYEAEQQL